MSNGSYQDVFRTPGFRPLLLSQLLVSFNDHTYKIAVSLLAVDLARRTGHGEGVLELIAALFVLPFLLGSGYAGRLADVWSKRRVLIAMKVVEVTAMAAGLAGFALQSLPLMVGVVFVMGIHSTFYSPAKCGIVPELLPLRHLSRANGLIDMTSYLAIVLGTTCGSLLAGLWHNEPWRIGVLLTLLALTGLLASFRIGYVPPSGAHKAVSLNPWAEIGHGLRRLRQNAPLRRTVMGSTAFWFLAALTQMAVLVIGRDELHANELHTGLLVAALAVGIGAGSILAGKLSGDHVELALVPVGCSILGLALTGIGLAHGSYEWTAAALFTLGIGGGLTIVPLDAFLQHEADPQERGMLLGTANFLSTSAALAASGILWVAQVQYGATASTLLSACGLLVLCGGVYSLKHVARRFVRFVLECVVRTCYRLDIVGAENIPQHGAALIIANHVTFVDGFLIGACTKRMIRFLVWDYYYNRFRWMLQFLHALPVPLGRPRDVVQMINRVRQELQAGELVGIFPEGNLTKHGNLQAFQRGMEKMTHGLEIPVIPVHVHNSWGSIFSFKGGRFVTKWPEVFPRPIRITIGSPLPSNVTAAEAREAVQGLGAQNAQRAHQPGDQLQTRFIASAKRHPSRLALADSTGKSLTYRKALIASLLLSRKLRTLEGEHLGILLPASVGGALVNIAALFAGKKPVNLNFTAGKEAMQTAVDQCGIRVTVTSKVFLAKAKLEAAPGMLFVEDLLAQTTTAAKISATLTSLLPAWVLKRLYRTEGGNPDALATVLFSSGSTGVPKGVMLSHRNILANIDSCAQVYPMGAEDRIAGVLPFFHSFGFNFTLWFPLTQGIAGVYHPNPTDGKGVGELVQQNRATILLATPTFAANYTRVCTAEQFATLRIVLVGAEKLRASVGQAFAEKFGIVPREGYGATEMAPVIAVNIPDVQSGVLQRGQKAGSVGLPLPGVAVRVVDPETMAPRPPGESGLVLVMGANRMQGYLNQPEKTAAVLREGWYITGDIGHVDDEGFLHLTDRLSRFSKIGGEMVPHLKVEDAINELLAVGHRSCVVALPDESKGEKLAVLYTDPDVAPATLWQQLSATGMPKLWLPKRDALIQVEQLPTLGTGKTDLQRAKAIAAGSFAHQD